MFYVFASALPVVSNAHPPLNSLALLAKKKTAHYGSPMCQPNVSHRCSSRNVLVLARYGDFRGSNVGFKSQAFATEWRLDDDFRTCCIAFFVLQESAFSGSPSLLFRHNIRQCAVLDLESALRGFLCMQ